MHVEKTHNLRERVTGAAEAVLDREGAVGPLELLQELGFLPRSHVQAWRKGSTYLTRIEGSIQCGADKLRKVYAIFREWAAARNLQLIESPYLGASVHGGNMLRITVDGDPAREKFFVTRYTPGSLPPRREKQIRAKLEKAPDLVVFELVSKKSKCSECGTELLKGNFLFMEKQQPLCLECADLDHLECLPRGDAALSRRARKYSKLCAVVVRFSRTRGRYERQGILATPEAISRAEDECAADADVRAARRAQDSQHRRDEDRTFVEEFTHAIRTRFPHCPLEEAREIAEHTAERSSGRVGRSAMGRALEPEAIELAVMAHVRHQHTRYDELLMRGIERLEARDEVRDKIDELLQKWQ